MVAGEEQRLFGVRARWQGIKSMHFSVEIAVGQGGENRLSHGFDVRAVKRIDPLGMRRMFVAKFHRVMDIA